MRHEAPRLLEAAPHWRGAREQQLLMPYCSSCARYFWPATSVCGACGDALQWRPCSGTGAVVTWSVVRRAADSVLNESVPYVVAIVALDEGVRLFTNIVDVDPDAVRTGMRVRCRFEATTDEEAWVPVFSPEG